MELLDKLAKAEVLVFVVPALIILVWLLADTWYWFRIKEWETALKQSMIERGMSADEIKAILEATAKHEPQESCHPDKSSQSLKSAGDLTVKRGAAT